MANKKNVRENTGNLEDVLKHREFCMLKLYSLILKIKNIVIFATKISNFFLETGYVCRVSFAHETVANQSTGNFKI